MEIKLVLVILCALGNTHGQQLTCYSCGFSATDSDQSCLTITENTNTVPCTSTYCTIMRQEYVDPPGAVASFVRGCEQSPAYLNHEVTDSTFRTFFRACTSSNCNIGNGIESVTGNNLSPTPLYNGINLLVPGTGGTSGANLNTISISLIIVGVITTILMNIHNIYS